MRTLFRIASIFVLIAACQPGASSPQGSAGMGDPYYPDLGNGGYDVQNYTLVLNIDPPTDEVTASAEIQAKATQSLESFNLDFTGLTIDAITVDGSPAIYTRSAGELTITPAALLEAGKEFDVLVTYHGKPAPVPNPASTLGFPEDGWFQAPSGAINIVDEPFGASGWFPVNNHPRDKATYRFEITVPNPWMVAATGTLQQTVEQGDHTTSIWTMDEPVASYLASINVDQYTVKTLPGPDGILVRNYFPPGFPESSALNFDQIPAMLTYLQTLFGPYPFKSYGVVVANLQDPLCLQHPLSAETQTLSVHCPTARMTSEQTIVHELAHQWFGDSVSLKNWKDIWLKEGMATYTQFLWAARGKDLPALTAIIKSQTQGYVLSTPIGNPPPANLYGSEVYLGGALVFHALRLKVGDEAFFKILRTYLDRYKYGNAGTDDFISLAEEVSGQDLKSSFDAWLYRTRVPEMK